MTRQLLLLWLVYLVDFETWLGVREGGWARVGYAPGGKLCLSFSAFSGSSTARV